MGGRHGRTLTSAWIETISLGSSFTIIEGRTLTSAWIETTPSWSWPPGWKVALSRVRGLKPALRRKMKALSGRTLTSAWIETSLEAAMNFGSESHSHECVD